MLRKQTLRGRYKLVSKLPITGELLSGTLWSEQSDTPIVRNAGAGKATRGADARQQPTILAQFQGAV
jgi:hypothetical protein